MLSFVSGLEPLQPLRIARAVGLGIAVPVAPSPASDVETAGSPRFLGNPNVHMPCSSTPAGPSAPGHYGETMLPSAVTTASAPATLSSFGAQSHGLSTRCLRFAAEVALEPRKTRFRLSAYFAGRDCLPAGFHCKV